MDRRTKLQALHDNIANRLAEIEVDLFVNPDDYRLTFIARHIGNTAAHIIVSNEEPEERNARVRETLEALEQDSENFRTSDDRTACPMEGKEK